MRKLLTLVAVVGLVSTAACKKEEPKAKAPPIAEPVQEAPVVEEPVVEEPVAEEAEGAEMTNKMEHCPSSVAGAKTEVKANKKTVMVTVTGADEEATKEIRIRAAYLAGLNGADATEVKHSGEGTGGSALGKCPVVLGHAKLEAKDIKGGSAITMTPIEGTTLEDLIKLANDRAAALATGATGPDGHGAGEHPGEHRGGGPGVGQGGGGGHGGGGGEDGSGTGGGKGGQ